MRKSPKQITQKLLGALALATLLIQPTAQPMAKVFIRDKEVPAKEINDIQCIEYITDSEIKSNILGVPYYGKIVPLIREDGKFYIPVRSLGEAYTYTYNRGDTEVFYTDASKDLTAHVKVTDTSITSLSNSRIIVQIQTSYWDKTTKKINTVSDKITVAPNATEHLTYYPYIISREPVSIHFEDTGTTLTTNPLKTNTYLPLVTDYIRLALAPIEEVFKPFLPEYTIKTTGEIVKLKSKQGKSCTVIYADGTEDVLDSSRIYLNTRNILDRSKVTDAQVVKFVETMKYTSPTDYLVFTDLSRQYTHVLKKKGNSWEVVKSLLSSSGLNSTPTPTGQYHLTKKVPYFGVEKGYRCKHAVGFIGGSYLYHSTIFNKEGTHLLEGKGVLGAQASQGCIRFSPEEAEWFYNTLPLNSTVIIR